MRFCNRIEIAELIERAQAMAKLTGDDCWLGLRTVGEEFRMTM